MKTIIGLIIALALSVTPALAQHQGASHSGNTNHSTVHDNHSVPGHFNGDGGKHTPPEARAHYNGRHFDSAWHNQYVGHQHRFFINRRVYYGGHYRFWYGGFWFYDYEFWPSDWCDCDPFWIDYDASTDCYFMYNFRHPGLRIRLGIVF